jgi:hypothetical protein
VRNLQPSREKLTAFDRYAAWGLESFRGGGIVGPAALPVLILSFFDAGPGARPGWFAPAFYVCGAAGVCFALFSFYRGWMVKKAELHRMRHLDAFFRRKHESKKSDG